MRFGIWGALTGAVLGIYIFFSAADGFADPFEVAMQFIGILTSGGRSVVPLLLIAVFAVPGAVLGGILGALFGAAVGDPPPKSRDR